MLFPIYPPCDCFWLSAWRLLLSIHWNVDRTFLECVVGHRKRSMAKTNNCRVTVKSILYCRGLGCLFVFNERWSHFGFYYTYNQNYARKLKWFIASVLLFEKKSDLDWFNEYMWWKFEPIAFWNGIHFHLFYRMEPIRNYT